MPGALADKVAVVTGASRGIGRAIAQKLASAGCDVAVNYYNSTEEAEALCAEIRAMGRRAYALQASVGIPDRVDDMFAELRKAFDPLDITNRNVASRGLKPVMIIKLKNVSASLEPHVLPVHLVAHRRAPVI